VDDFFFGWVWITFLGGCGLLYFLVEEKKKFLKTFPAATFTPLMMIDDDVREMGEKVHSTKKKLVPFFNKFNYISKTTSF
jgi:hypothetical protein